MIGRRRPTSPGSGDAVIVHEVLAGNAVSWTVLGEDGLPAESAEAYLAYLAALERSPNTLRAYASQRTCSWSGPLATRRRLAWPRDRPPSCRWSPLLKQRTRASRTPAYTRASQSSARS
jgi:hypothetical protein